MSGRQGDQYKVLNIIGELRVWLKENLRGLKISKTLLVPFVYRLAVAEAGTILSELINWGMESSRYIQSELPY